VRLLCYRGILSRKHAVLLIVFVLIYVETDVRCWNICWHISFGMSTLVSNRFGSKVSIVRPMRRYVLRALRKYIRVNVSINNSFYIKPRRTHYHYVEHGVTLAVTHNSRDVTLLHFTHRALFPRVIYLTCQLDTVALRLPASIIVLNANDLDFNIRTRSRASHEDSLALKKKIRTYRIHRIRVRNKQSLDRDCRPDAIFYVSREERRKPRGEARSLSSRGERMVCHRDKFAGCNPRSRGKYFYRLGRSARTGTGEGE